MTLYCKTAIFLFLLNSAHAAQYASLKYYADTGCSSTAYGVAVRPAHCIQTIDGSAWVTCSTSQGLVVSEFTTSDCLGQANNSIVVTSNVDNGCAFGSFAASNYFNVPVLGYRINCNDDQNVRPFFNLLFPANGAHSGPKTMMTLSLVAAHLHSNPIQPSILPETAVLRTMPQPIWIIVSSIPTRSIVYLLIMAMVRCVTAMSPCTHIATSV